MRHVMSLLLSCLACAAWSADDVEALKQRIAALEQEVIELKSRSVPFSALIGEGITISCWHPVDERGALAAPMRKLLSLSDAEGKAVDAALIEARARIVEAVAAQKPQPVIADGKLTLALAPFRDTGKKAQDGLKKAVADALGKERAALFDKLAKSQLGEPFLQFGQAEYTYTVERTAMGYSYQVEHKSGGSSGTSSGTSPTLNDDFALVKPYIPAPFGGTAGDEAAPGAAAPAPAPAPEAKTRGEF